MSKLNLVVLGSTRGSNMQAIIDAINANQINASIDFVISNRKEAYILQRAKKYNIPSKFLNSQGLDRSKYDQLLIKKIQPCNPDLILLIGFMKILGSDFINYFRGKILNVHPSLLPKYAGLIDLDVHQSVINSKDVKTGCTIHKVTEDVDSGEIILQLECAVVDTDMPENLKKKVQTLENKAWIEVIKNWQN